MKSCFANILTGIWFLIASVGTLYAQTDSLDNGIPALNGHSFVSQININSPFVDSHFGMNLGIAQTDNFSSIIIDIDGQQIEGLKGALVYADLNFDYRQRIKDWIAFDAKIGLTARVGTEVKSLIAQGLNTVTSVRLGWKLRLYEKQKTMLSANIFVNKFDANIVSIKDFITDLIRDSTITSISRTVPMLNVGTGLQFAWGISDVVGLQAYANVMYGDSYERGSSEFLYNTGGAIDINLANNTRVPLGFSLGFISGSLPNIVQVKGKTSSQMVFKIGYTGGRQYDLGLEITDITVPLRDVRGNVNSTGFFVSSKYYFNK